MQPMSRHQCLIYHGAPSQHLSALASVVHEKLQQNYRCLYLNSRPMVAGMGSYLAATGIDVASEVAKSSLVLSSERQHLVDGRFDVDAMIQTLEDTVRRALSDGFAGLWATGDMTWEMGSDRDFSRLLEYEWRLEEFMREHPEMGGICQYHADTVPRAIVRQGLLVHQTIFVNETLSLLNPEYLRREDYRPEASGNPGLDSLLARICPSESAHEDGC